ncbi:hypothetical protein NKI69_02435 [Mesorhizobium sp. M0491]
MRGSAPPSRSWNHREDHDRGAGRWLCHRNHAERADRSGAHRVLIAALAGRAAEEVIVGSVAAGSGSESCDLAAATALAFDMETVMGFSKKWPLLYRKVEDRTSLLATDHELAMRVNARLESAYAVAQKMVINQKVAIDFLGEILLERKTLEGPELDAVLGQVRERIVASPN